MNERPEHRKRARQQEIEGMDIDGLRAELTRTQEFLAKVKDFAKSLPEKPDEKDKEASRAYFVSHRKWREIRDKHLDPHYERVEKLMDLSDEAFGDFSNAASAMADGTGSREEMLQKKEAFKDALYNSVNARLDNRRLLTRLLNKALEADVVPPRAWFDGETGLIMWLEMDVKYVARNLRYAWDAQERERKYNARLEKSLQRYWRSRGACAPGDKVNTFTGEKCP